MPEKPIVISICGMGGTGKSTVSRRLAEKYGLRYVSGGDALKTLAVEEGYDIEGRGWWETDKGRQFLEQRIEDPRFDKKIDRQLIEWAERGNVILDSWTMPWLVKKGFKIWLDASIEKRAKRIAKRDGISVREALQALESKEEKTKKIYNKLYGFKLGEDFKPFHLILDTDHLKVQEVFQTLCTVLDNMIFHPYTHC
jgi:cytidylate kinase